MRRERDIQAGACHHLVARVAKGESKGVRRYDKESLLWQFTVAIRSDPVGSQEEFLAPLGISQTRLALDLHVPAPRINAIVRGKRAITADTALRLGQYFKMEPQFWLNLQANYDLGVASGGVWSRVKKLIPEFMPENAAAVL